MHGQQNNITFWGLAEGTVRFASLHFVSWSQRHCASVLQAGSLVHKSHNSAFLRSHSNSTSRHKSNVLILRNVAWYSLAVAGACYVLNWTDIVIANAKYPPGQHTKYRGAGKSLSNHEGNKLHSPNCMELVSSLPDSQQHITSTYPSQINPSAHHTSDRRSLFPS